MHVTIHVHLIVYLLFSDKILHGFFVVPFICHDLLKITVFYIHSFDMS